MGDDTTAKKKGESGGPGRDAEDLRAIAETLQGHHDAFRVIIERHGGMVLRLAVSFLKDREEAEDASQEIFFRAFRSLRSFSLEKPFVPWLYAVAMNYLRTRKARTRKMESRIVRGESEIATKSSNADPVAVFEAEATRSGILSAIASLPEGIREVVALFYGEAMSVSQISALLGIGNENVKSRLHRGRKRLRESLDRDATQRASEG